MEGTFSSCPPKYHGEVSAQSWLVCWYHVVSTNQSTLHINLTMVVRTTIQKGRGLTIYISKRYSDWLRCWSFQSFNQNRFLPCDPSVHLSHRTLVVPSHLLTQHRPVAGCADSSRLSFTRYSPAGNLQEGCHYDYPSQDKHLPYDRPQGVWQGIQVYHVRVVSRSGPGCAQ